MSPTEIALIVASVIPSLIMLWLTRGIQKSDEMQKQVDSIDKRVVAVEAGQGMQMELMKRLELHIARLEDKMDRIISTLTHKQGL